jgi:hypothetical protein
MFEKKRKICENNSLNSSSCNFNSYLMEDLKNGCHNCKYLDTSMDFCNGEGDTCKLWVSDIQEDEEFSEPLDYELLNLNLEK